MFAAESPLDAAGRDALLAEVDRFLAQWAAHGAPVVAGREWRDDRFLLIGVDERATGLSGCSIDALVRSLRALQSRVGAAIVDAPPVWYRGPRGIETISRDTFESLADRGSVGPDTIVFDNTLASVGELRAGRFELPASETWHGAAFFRENST
ncbi:MAG: hypothetical protein R3344_06580 [Acidobacteriota bacterium]|nr:hypothetical protein [Acidobacteriota bacterium]